MISKTSMVDPEEINVLAAPNNLKSSVSNSSGSNNSAAKDPSAKDPPAQGPPARDPPAQGPPARDPPAQGPPARDPPAQDPPARDSPTRDPPTRDPPARDPSAKDPPARDPPAQDPPAQDPPVQDSSAQDPSAKDPPAKIPPAKDPKVKNPSAKNPPAQDPELFTLNSQTDSSPVLITVAGQTYTANSGSAFVIYDQTLMPDGSPITINGHSIRLAGFRSSHPVADGTDMLFVTSRVPTMAEVFIYIYTANSASAFVIDGQVLTAGGMITVSGTPISYAAEPSPAEVVVGVSSPSMVLLGELIMEGFQNGSRFGSAAGDGGGGDIIPFTGAANRNGKGAVWRRGWRSWICTIGITLIIYTAWM